MKKLAGLLLWGLFIVVGCAKAPVILTADEQLVYDMNKIDEYAAEKGIANVVKLESGVRYAITEMGTGRTPTKDDCVTYIYYFFNITSPDTLQANITGYTAALKSQVTGMQIALKQLPIGTKAIVLLPSGLAYGTTGATGVPKNSNLRWDVYLTGLSNYNALGNYCYK